jgi:hypothetical protein
VLKKFARMMKKKIYFNDINYTRKYTTAVDNISAFFSIRKNLINLKINKI